MINIRYGKPKKLACPQSIYVSFPYDQYIVNIIRIISERHWDSKEKEWELPYDRLQWLQERIRDEEFNITGTPLDNSDCRVKKVDKTYDIPKGILTKPYQHQIDGFNIIMNNDKFLLLDEAGNGKSLQAIMSALKRKESGVKHTLIVCCVNSIKWNWAKEIKIHAGEEAMVLGARKNRKGLINVRSNADKLEDLNNLNEFFIVTNIESLRDKAILKKLKGLCKSGEIDYIIVDEAHVTKNPGAQMGKALLQLKTKYKLVMTGTPLINKPTDLFLPLKFIEKLSCDFRSYKARYCIFGAFNAVVGYQHLDELQTALESVSIRRLKRDTIDLPPITYKDDYVELGKAQQKVYNDVLAAIIADIDKVNLSINPLSQLIRLRQATACTSILSSTVDESAKLCRAEEIISEVVESGGKVVVFSNWTSVTDRAIEKLKEYNPAVITGDVKDKDRTAQEDKFRNDDTCKVLIGTIKAAGTGLTFTSANTVIFLDESWTHAYNEQCAQRIYRIGQKDKCSIITLLARNTIDERIHNVVEYKKRLSDGIVDNKYDLQDRDTIRYLIGEIDSI